MSSQVTLLIPTVTAGVANTAAGYNGSDTTWYSIASQASGYYGYSQGINTVAYYTDQYFMGSLTVQVSLASNPGPNDWVSLSATTVSNSNPTSQQGIATTVNFFGNYVWARIMVSNFIINPNQGPGLYAGSILKCQYAF
jgi:hypothetical protein